MLHLTDPPHPPPPEDHPHLRLVPKGPPVRFRVPQDPEVPWFVRAVALTLGVVISAILVTGIIFAGSFIKYVYDQMDAREKARTQERRAVPRGPEGSIPVVISPDQPAPPAGKAPTADEEADPGAREETAGPEEPPPGG